MCYAVKYEDITKYDFLFKDKTLNRTLLHFSGPTTSQKK